MAPSDAYCLPSFFLLRACAPTENSARGTARLTHAVRGTCAAGGRREGGTGGRHVAGHVGVSSPASASSCPPRRAAVAGPRRAEVAGPRCQRPRTPGGGGWRRARRRAQGRPAGSHGVTQGHTGVHAWGRTGSHRVGRCALQTVASAATAGA
eukprot:865751-Prymnesium_polylepis.1